MTIFTDLAYLIIAALMLLGVVSLIAEKLDLTAETQSQIWVLR